MTELEAKQIQNSINVLQEVLDAHYASINRIRPQQKGMMSRKPNASISWKLEHGILHHIEFINTGNIPLSINVSRLYRIHSPTHCGIRETVGECLGVVYVAPGNTETPRVGYPCDHHNPIVIKVKDAVDNEILETIVVE
jgi:hypothetical protein